MSQATIRHVAPEDAGRIADILQAPHVVRGTMRLPYQSPASVAARISDDPGAYKLVAVVDGMVAGYAELVIQPDLPRHRHAGELNMIATHPDFRGRGVGEALMVALLDLADRWLGLTRVGLTVWAQNDRAIDLYARHGFVEEGRLRQYVLVDGVLCDAMVMGRCRSGS
jgi:putative acetyltransferase